MQYCMAGDLNSCLSKGKLLPIASTIPYSTPKLPRICCVTFIREKKHALVSRMFLCAILLIPTLRRYPGQLFYGQYPDRALLGPCRPSHMIRTTCPKNLDWFLSKSGILTIGNHQPIGYIGATTYSRNSGCRWSTHSILTM